MGIHGHQLIYCYGVNKGEQKRARTMTNRTSKQLQPQISVSPPSPGSIRTRLVKNILIKTFIILTHLYLYM